MLNLNNQPVTNVGIGRAGQSTISSNGDCIFFVRTCRSYLDKAKVHNNSLQSPISAQSKDLANCPKKRGMEQKTVKSKPGWCMT